MTDAVGPGSNESPSSRSESVVANTPDVASPAPLATTSSSADVPAEPSSSRPEEGVVGSSDVVSPTPAQSPPPSSDATKDATTHPVDDAKPVEKTRQADGTKKQTGTTRQAGKKKTGRLVGVTLPNSCMTFRFFTTARDVQVGDLVLLRTKENETVGSVAYVTDEGTRDAFQDRVFTGVYESNEAKSTGIRVLSKSDRQFFDVREKREHEAKIFCREKIREMKLPMKLSNVRYLLTGHKAVFFFTAENRVDFRELVRLLGSHLKMRVEMRHVGVRDEAKILGGMGLCGNEFCCSQFLKKFHPVSVRMAKIQELSLNPEGISGTCGRLLCCLAYENSAYQALREGLPKTKKRVQTVDGREGVVYSVYPLTESVGVQFGDGSRVNVPRCELCGPGGHRAEAPTAVADHQQSAAPSQGTERRGDTASPPGISSPGTEGRRHTESSRGKRTNEGTVAPSRKENAVATRADTRRKTEVSDRAEGSATPPAKPASAGSRRRRSRRNAEQKDTTARPVAQPVLPATEKMPATTSDQVPSTSAEGTPSVTKRKRRRRRRRPSSTNAQETKSTP